MMHFIAYNKDAEWEAIEPGGDYFGHWSRHPYTRLQETLGETVWVISGERVDGKMVYRLCHYYRPENIEEENGSFLVEGPGRGFEPHIDVTDDAWFQELFQEQNNFSYGLNRKKSERVIESLLQLRNSSMGKLSNDSRIAPVKALTVRPLWAWAILHAGKSIENRS
ncbi:MAG: hypothetical protein SF339_15335 [Blastocatellia bacterium]|nr:hypothetical protein [Blastocatellia bacterium]